MKVFVSEYQPNELLTFLFANLGALDRLAQVKFL